MLSIDGVGFDWSDMAEEQVQTNIALMAFSDSEVYNDKSCSKTCLKNYETLKKQCDDLIIKLNETEFKAATYKRGLETIKEQLVTFRKNKVLFGEEIAVLKREVGYKDYELGVLKTEFEKVKQEKEGIDFKIAKFNNASKSLDKLLESQITDKSKKGLGYHVIAPPHPLSLNAPTKLDLSYSGLDEFKDPEFNMHEQVSEDEISSVESSPNVVKETIFHTAEKITKSNGKPEKLEWSEVQSTRKKRMMTGNNYNRVDYDYYAKSAHPNTHRNMTLRAVLLKSGLKPLSTVRPVNTVRPIVVNTARPYTAPVNTVKENKGKPQLNDKGFVDSGCSRHMTGNIAYLSDFKEFDGGYVTFGGGAYGGRISRKGTLKTDNLNFEDGSNTESLACPRFTWVFFLTTKDETSEILKNFIKEIENLVDKKVKIIRCDNGTEFKNKASLIARSDEGFFFGYSLSSKAFRVYNTRTKKVEENLHVGFLENKLMIAGNGPKWLFDINSLTQSMNYVPVAAGTSSNDSAGTQGEFNADTSTQKEQVSQDCIVMPIWKDTTYFDSPSKIVSNKPKSASDDQEQAKDGPNDEKY
ncbi:putative ribonuclease H-like domain-containing protein [Tanacetum coccineum]